jgi:hypothetical protein
MSSTFEITVTSKPSANIQRLFFHASGFIKIFLILLSILANIHHVKQNIKLIIAGLVIASI